MSSKIGLITNNNNLLRGKAKILALATLDRTSRKLVL